MQIVLPRPLSGCGYALDEVVLLGLRDSAPMVKASRTPVPSA